MLQKHIKNKIKKIFAEIIIMVISVCIIILIADNERKNIIKSTGEEKSDVKDYGKLTLWYNNKDYENYLNILTQEYKKEKGININLKFISDIDYFDSINKSNKHTDDTNDNPPDIYMLSSEELEEAYGYGLAAENDSPVYNEDNYSPAALKAITYKDKYVAYPLAFNTAFMIYNTDYMQSEPESFDKILSFEESFKWEDSPDVSHVLYFDSGDILHTYGFAGAYVNVGGENGDDSNILEIDEDNLKKSLSFYSSMSKRLRMNLKNDFSKLPHDFMDGKIICSIVDMKEFSGMRQMYNVGEIKYNVCEIPPVNEEINTKSLSYTEVMVVNYMSDKEELAKELAEYATYYRTDLIYSSTGMLPAKHIDYVDSFNETIQRQYDNSCLLPKLRVTKDYYLQMQSLINEAWKGSNIDEMIKSIKETYKIRLQ